MKEIKRSFPQNLAKPAQRVLLSKGISILNDLSRFTKSEIKGLHGIGPDAMEKITNEMFEEQISFAREQQDRERLRGN
ncbi:MAG: hypothetical protein NWQ55_03105 [Salibacteraceae bacterium]|jgi:hypothetical protein|nr:hypothetical protein [Salibacteraceae bacterium]MDP4687306.1 hypothetical protein [Salibacteraceae bacterium]MDP4843671.1 hypothetical protein [Salibacteraceae bacterium]MDP4934892.1 hypothetical protein [Salibacteraceae bacterium]MDP4964034.1 hypothetical protein [Salibacteraceae bacterium]